MAKVSFKNRKPNSEKLTAFGFVRSDNGYAYQTDIACGQLTLNVEVDADGALYTRVIDRSSGDEYVLHLVAGAAGSFVGGVKADYDAALKEIAAKCFDPDVFKSEQAQSIIAYIRDTYGDELEYLWKKFPDNAVVRRSDNQKWYAAILTVSRQKLGFDRDEIVEILDLRIAPEDIVSTVDHVRYFPGYHMNKQHWITICLDKTIPTEEICAGIDNSYRLAKKQRGAK